MLTKYDWFNVPKEVVWVATDSDRFKCYFISKPEMMPLWWKQGGEYYRCIAPEFNEYKGNWKDSLEKRPIVK